jgi:3-methyladenine DNA glycosylase/8-oxoguanine DNA glycosylase
MRRRVGPTGRPRPEAPTRHPTAIVELEPPRLSSFPQEREQLEYSSRSLVFASDGGRVLRVWGRPGRPWALAVEEVGSRWRATGYGPGPAETLAAVRSLFSLDHPIEQFYRQVRAEPVLAGTERTFRGLRLPRDASVFEALFHSILGQQVSVASANAIKQRLIDAVDAHLDVRGVSVPRVPSPAEILALGADGLRSNGTSGAKARSLLALAADEQAGRWSPEALDRLGTPEVVVALDAAPGVGRWTAENAALRGLGRPDAFVAGDLGVRVALAAYGAVPRSADESKARAWADRHYPGWGSYATLYLWRKWVTDGARSEPLGPTPRARRQPGRSPRSG